MPLTIDEQRAALDQLNLLAINDIVDLWREASPLAPAEFRSVITAGVPELLDPYIAGAGDLAATWYEEAAPQLTYRATAAAMPPAEQLATSAQWALRATGEAALVRLAGFSKRAILGAQRDTVLANVAHEPGARWARHASANACAFCRMLATRLDVYTSAQAAGEGNRYHDHCRCMAVAVRPGHTYEPPPYVEQWEREYRAASRETDGSTKSVLAHMEVSSKSASPWPATASGVGGKPPTTPPPGRGTLAAGGADDDAVRRIIDQAKRAEPAITDAVSNAVAGVSGQLERLDTRLKTPESVAEKLARNTARNLADAPITDAVRYTAVLPERDYWTGGNAVIEGLTGGEAGMSVVADPRGWQPRGYRGRNVVLATADGQQFELQLHTPASLDAAERAHAVYELERAPGVGSAQRKRYKREQQAIFDGVPWPDGLPEL